MSRAGGGCRSVGLVLVGLLAIALSAGLVGAVLLLRPSGEPDTDDGTAATVPFGAAELLCTVTDPAIAESSGLAVRGPNLYTVNDSGPELQVFVLDTACRVVAVRREPGIDPVDVEDLAVAADDALWVADIGDNDARRQQVRLYRMADLGRGTTTVYRLQYPDGPRDAETLLLSPDGTPYLVTKVVTGVSTVYAPAQRLDPGGVTQLRQVATVRFRLRTGGGGPVGAVGSLLATGGSVATGGSRMVIRTYTDAYVWDLRDGDVLGALRDATPAVVALPATPQGEAVALTSDALRLYSTSEGSPFPVDVQRATAGPAAPAALATRSAGGTRAVPPVTER